MVFPFPNYLDHPNLNQGHDEQSNEQVRGLPLGFVVGEGGSIRAGSMVDRARRIAKFPLPEAGAKCPRCDSTNTKFCYYNNYNLSQPRHFCKGCRRYWTKGGALRNVPVGGGCSRNKRIKTNGSSTSKSSTPGNHERRQIVGTNNNYNTNMAAAHHFEQPSTQSPLMAALHNFNQYEVQESGSHQHHGLGLGCNNNLSGPVWMLPSFQGAFDPPTSLFQFQREWVVEDHHHPSMPGTRTGSSSNNICNSVKMGNHQNGNQQLNLSRLALADSSEIPQQNWSSNAWTNGFSALNSSSTTHLS